MRKFRQLPPTKAQREAALLCPCCGTLPKGTGGNSFRVSVKLAMLVFNIPMAIWTAASSEKFNSAVLELGDKLPQTAEKLTSVDSTGLALTFWVLGDIALALAMLSTKG
ncbi:hypothetical protein [Ruegeria atlantica]|uniref:hypothetical protein n=1 Tax=Ruegeria atlantica TaxID=81569 RepID=UPI0014798CD9|nr:hypothetical protein [Ruegeria atlantica]